MLRSFYAFVKIVFRCDSISATRGRPSVASGGGAARGFVDPISIIAICDHPSQVIGFDNYEEDKGA